VDEATSNRNRKGSKMKPLRYVRTLLDVCAELGA